MQSHPETFQTRNDQMYYIIRETLFNGVEAIIHATKDNPDDDYTFRVEYRITKTDRKDN